MARTFVAQLDASGHQVPVRACLYEPEPPMWLFPSVGEYPLYDDFAYGKMLDDQARMARYAEAVRRYAPGRTVLDIGTGRDAVWALAAARAGASRVWAVEVIPESAATAREVIAAAGFADRITVVQGLSTEIDLPEPVDVCVSEIIGTLAGSEGAAAVLADARQRLVKPGGVFIPHRGVTTVVGFDLGRASAEPPGFPLFTFKYLEQMFAAVGGPFDPRVCLVGLQDRPEVQRRAYLSEAAEVEPLEFNGELCLGGVDAAEFVCTRAGRLHGLALGVRLWVAEGDEPLDSLVQASSWTPVYAPLSATGLPVRPGDRFTFEFSTALSDDGVHPDYALTGSLCRDVGPPVPLRWSSAHHRQGFRTDPFYRSLFPAA
ncbi:methyltransferase domain-containing protein [Crossiella cryophila]|uniref:Protein arginine N-methyltransferase 1 n=1 Tax=Crossiella cryophila TaxID=43355 RepID=A0A7W7CED2_9PSEU|nr:class I SAM-dependent methyltransferase [Crossiella cryophila]MBB4679601.1 protein arginine N-methyltransferase 1 [Crossiella cryophila]